MQVKELIKLLKKHENKVIETLALGIVFKEEEEGIISAIGTTDNIYHVLTHILMKMDEEPSISN